MSHLGEEGTPARWTVVPDRQAICRSDDTTGAVMGIFGPGYTRSSIISKCYNSDIPLRGKSTPPKVHTDRVRRKLSRFHMLNSESV